MDETKLFWIRANTWEQGFPAVHDALAEPDGLLAAGGNLSVQKLLNAYRQGIFPWYDEPQPILWWSPDPRCVLVPTDIHISRSLRKTINRDVFECTFDQAFSEVIHECALPRARESGTWLTRDMIQAYIDLHHAGHAHSIEAWRNKQLVGGLYGVAIGQVFFGESMFSRASDASKVCLAKLADWLGRWHYQLIDCQVHSEHLQRMGAEQINRENFLELLTRYCRQHPSSEAWDCSQLKRSQYE